MTKKDLFEMLANCPDDAPVNVTVRTRHGNFTRVLYGGHGGRDGDPIHLVGGEEWEPEEWIPLARPPADPKTGRTVKPLPSCPYVGPNGEIFPMGGAPPHVH